MKSYSKSVQSPIMKKHASVLPLLPVSSCADRLGMLRTILRDDLAFALVRLGCRKSCRRHEKMMHPAEGEKLSGFVKPDQ